MNPRRGATNCVSVTVTRGVADVRLNRPDKLNALNLDMFYGLVAAGRGLIGRDDLRAVVLSGSGRAFCAGLDFSQFARMSDGVGESVDFLVQTDERLGGARALGQQAVRIWSQISVPVIAGVHGVAFGGGLQIALGADIRIVGPATELSVMEIEWGLIPDMAGTQLLPELVGRDVAKDLTFTGRKVRGEEGVRLGLATRLAESPIAAAHELAVEIARHDTEAIMHAKRLLDMAGRVSIEDGLDAEQASVADLLTSEAAVRLRRSRLRRYLA